MKPPRTLADSTADLRKWTRILLWVVVVDFVAQIALVVVKLSR